MQRSTAIKVFKLTGAVTVLPVIVGVCIEPMLIVVFGFIGFVFMCIVANRIEPGTNAPRAARRHFLNKHRRKRKSLEANAALVGSSAWLVEHDLTGAFGTDDDFPFKLALHHFDSHEAFSINSANSSNNHTFLSDSSFDFDSNRRSSMIDCIDYVHGGTDSTGMGGMGGHNDQGFGSSMSDSSFSSFSHD